MQKTTKVFCYPLILICLLLFTYGCSKLGGSKKKNKPVTDKDGNEYTTVTIGTQVWMAQNLKVTKYRNGDPIPNITDTTQWAGLSTGAFCNYGNLDTNGAVYGKLYNWYAVNDIRKLAPEGWHIPADSEWVKLIAYLGGDGVAGGKLKEIGTYRWLSPNADANDSSGFSARPGGYRHSGGGFYDLGTYTYWWTSTGVSPYSSYYHYVYYNNGISYRTATSQKDGFSVRCIKD